jgi:hypothetical protein
LLVYIVFLSPENAPVPERKREHGSHSKKRMRANKRFITADE